MSLARAYRAALVLYPRSFRREYAADMVALFDAQRRDEGAARVVGRAALDLLVTVPTRHLEARMSGTSSTPLIIVLVALGAAGAIVGGPVGLAAAAALIGLAGLTWSRNRPVVNSGDGRWWKLLLSGALLLAALIVVTTWTGELPSGGWYVAMALGLTSLVLMAAGVVLGLASRSRAA